MKAGGLRVPLNQYPRQQEVATPSRLISVPNAEALCIAPAQHSQGKRSCKFGILDDMNVINDLTMNVELFAPIG
jgi:hypothetical protein